MLESLLAAKRGTAAKRHSFAKALEVWSTGVLRTKNSLQASKMELKSE